MPLIKCRDCDAQISASAWTCPQCNGWQIQRPNKAAERAAALFFAAVVALAYWLHEPISISTVIFGALPLLIVWIHAQQNRVQRAEPDH